MVATFTAQPHLASVRPAGRPHGRVHRRRRVVVVGCLLVVLSTVCVAMGWLVRGSAEASATTAPVAQRPVAARIWVVRPGDTLWAIAQASGARGDIRPLVDRLSDEVDGRPLSVGERISLP